MSTLSSACCSVDGMKTHLMFIGILIAVALLSQSQPVAAQEFHFNIRVEAGGTDSDYPDCNGGLFSALGGSVEIGQPVFGELLAEAAGIKANAQCLPVRRNPDWAPIYVGVKVKSPTYRLGAGIGRRYLNEHIALAGRGGVFLNKNEPFLSSVLTMRASYVTLGFELGQIHARWEYEDRFVERKWSTFGGVSLGLRF